MPLCICLLHPLESYWLIHKLSSIQDIWIYFFLLFIILPSFVTLLFWDHHLPHDQTVPRHHLSVLWSRGNLCLKLKANSVHTSVRQSCRKLSHGPISKAESLLLASFLVLACYVPLQFRGIIPWPNSHTVMVIFWGFERRERNFICEESGLVFSITSFSFRNPINCVHCKLSSNYIVTSTGAPGTVTIRPCEHNYINIIGKGKGK